jgi:hypothetical protein
MQVTAKQMISAATLGLTLVAGALAHAAQPGGPPGQAPTEVTGSVAVTNFPTNQAVTIGNEVDVNVVNSNRIQISIVGETSDDEGPKTGLIVRADGGGSFAAVPQGMKLVLTDFIVAVGVPQAEVIGDEDDFFGNINRAAPGSDCSNSQQRKKFRVFRRDQVISSLATGLEFFAGDKVCLVTGSQGTAPKNVGLGYEIIGYLTPTP